ncbi:MAG: HAMP domain-containing sensor histidine kinase [Methylicorpusculum sp.]|uniref:HAMP domain-containing sensor histidine kinase n=1 Tax=Methylicorpusculum sp. TaxID=2713644 RepID=UPI00272364CA|nr:HAMP domain-containing sensor histidine kinase [Methylicorpusculum sp.]MDO8941073.1 HAMP domain-containing sensor histidine kinase [Methylicorpusculum sp.]MDP2202328.1 HAMP domain-containing sensor histidine kinase [Methylicorpusculum sp.]
MKGLATLDLRQRYNVIVLTAILFATALLMMSVNLVIAKYAREYTHHYWQEYVNTYSDSVTYNLIIGSQTATEDISRHFAADKNVIKAAVYQHQQEAWVTTNTAVACTPQSPDYTQPFVYDQDDAWCFYAPVYQDSAYLGYVELVIAKAEFYSLLAQIVVYSGLIVLVFSTFIFYVVSHFAQFFTTTLLELAAVSKKTSQGIRGNRVTFSGAADIDLIRDAFNDMMSKIEDHEQMLEQVVADRTQELKVALTTSQAANEYKSQLMAIVSHEMKTPLHAIQNYLELASEELPQHPDFESIAFFHTRAKDRATDLSDLISKMLLHGKLESNNLSIALTQVAIKPLVEECAAKIAGFLERNQNTLSLVGDDWMIRTDRELLRHIINNVLNNACKFTEQGSIIVTWWREESGLGLTISDTGCGIPSEYHDKIFNDFWQADMSLTRKYGGHGLGLTITKRFVELLGGQITVAANAEQGTAFTIRIPHQLN